MRSKAPNGNAGDMVAQARRACERITARLDYVQAGGPIDDEVAALEEALEASLQLEADMRALRFRWDNRRRSRREPCQRKSA